MCVSACVVYSRSPTAAAALPFVCIHQCLTLTPLLCCLCVCAACLLQPGDVDPTAADDAAWSQLARRHAQLHP